MVFGIVNRTVTQSCNIHTIVFQAMLSRYDSILYLIYLMVFLLCRRERNSMNVLNQMQLVLVKNVVFFNITFLNAKDHWYD